MVKNIICLLILILALFMPAGALRPSDEELTALLGGIIQSDKWLINQESGEEEFIGHVRYNNEIYKINADYALSKRRAQTFTFTGNVFAKRQDRNSSAQISARTIFYNKDKDYGWALGAKNKQIVVSYAAQDNTLWAFADRADFGKNFSKYKLSGYAQLQDKDNTLNAREINFNAETGDFSSFGGRPLLFGFSDDGDYALQADAVTAQTKDGKFKAAGQVEGWLTSTDDISLLPNTDKKNGTKSH